MTLNDSVMWITLFYFIEKCIYMVFEVIFVLNFQKKLLRDGQKRMAFEISIKKNINANCYFAKSICPLKIPSPVISGRHPDTR